MKNFPEWGIFRVPRFGDVFRQAGTVSWVAGNYRSIGEGSLELFLGGSLRPAPATIELAGEPVYEPPWCNRPSMSSTYRARASISESLSVAYVVAKRSTSFC